MALSLTRNLHCGGTKAKFAFPRMLARIPVVAPLTCSRCSLILDWIIYMTKMNNLLFLIRFFAKHKKRKKRTKRKKVCLWFVENENVSQSLYADWASPSAAVKSRECTNIPENAWLISTRSSCVRQLTIRFIATYNIVVKIGFCSIPPQCKLSLRVENIQATGD